MLKLYIENWIHDSDDEDYSDGEEEIGVYTAKANPSGSSAHYDRRDGFGTPANDQQRNEDL